ncbi:hypothetical protein Bca52824_033116 [Brassica carinata]|uniref:Uncharacterized protein n=1 Tax=Brassica carinata TaxID=52824 RepID=A0A8X7SFF1_BRACI|nr:hypothetical protein Bca52824_033116 [Brassica carinata]
MMKRPMQDVYGSDAAEGFNKGKKEMTEHYRALLCLSNEHRKSEVAWTVASGTVNSLDDQIELLNAIIESEGKFDLVAELEKLTLEHAETEDIRGGIKVVVKCILGDPELHSNLVEDVDGQFGRVVDLVKRGYRLKRKDWRNGKINIAVAEAEVKHETENQTQDEAEQQEEPDVEVEDSVQLQRKKRERVNKNAQRELSDDENLLSYMIAQKQQNTKEQSQDEDDVELDDGDKERETSKSIEVRTHNEEEQREEGDVEVQKTVQPQRKKRGIGKKNQTNEETVVEAKKPEEGEKKKGGRARGKKNQTNEEKEQQEKTIVEAKKPEEGEKKKRGRPRGKRSQTHEGKEQQENKKDKADAKVEKPVQVRNIKRGRGKKAQEEEEDEQEKCSFEFTKDVYGSDAAEGINKGKKETTEHYRALLHLSNEHRKSEVAWTVASGTVNSLDDQIELLNVIIESEGKFDLVAELEKLTLEHAEAEDIHGGIKVKIPDWDKLGEKWLLEE